MKPAAAAKDPAQTQAVERKEEGQEEQASVPMEEDKLQSVQLPAPKNAGAQQSDKAKAVKTTQAEAATATQGEAAKAPQAEAQTATQATVAGKPEAAKEDDEQKASPMEGVGDEGGEKKEEGDGRGVKRPSAPVARVAKQARTNQAAGEPCCCCTSCTELGRTTIVTFT